MSDDYLWDRSAPADPEIVRLERVLGTLAQRAPPPGFAFPGTAPGRRSTVGWVVALGTLAATAALTTLAWRAPRWPGPTLSVTAIEGTPRIGSRAVTDRRDLPAGPWLETDAVSRASVELGDIGRVDLDPRTRMALVDSRSGDYRLRLARGTMHAVIWAPPGRVFVETPTSTAIDLGCAYSLSVDDRGVGTVRVTSGWVAFEWRGRESFIPAGAMCTTRRGLGPGTPHYEDAPADVRQAIDLIDGGGADPAVMDAALDVVLARAQARDAVTLWHLLTRVGTGQRGRVFDALARAIAPPAGVTRDGVISGDRAMLDRWWDGLGLGASSWWRTWQQRWRDEGAGK